MMRPMDLDRSADVWTYRPESHKTEHHGKERIIYIGPQGEEVFAAIPGPRQRASIVFRRRDRKRSDGRNNMRRVRRRYRAARSQGIDASDAPRRRPGDRYDVASYRRSIHRACDRAFPLSSELARRKGETSGAWIKRLSPIARIALSKHYAEHRWSPNRLRHAMATEVRRHFGLEMCADNAGP